MSSRPSKNHRLPPKRDICVELVSSKVSPETKSSEICIRMRVPGDESYEPTSLMSVPPHIALLLLGHSLIIVSPIRNPFYGFFKLLFRLGLTISFVLNTTLSNALRSFYLIIDQSFVLGVIYVDGFTGGKKANTRPGAEKSQSFKENCH